MNYEERKELLANVERIRGGRTLLCFFNFDRASDPQLPGLATQFHADVKEAIFRILKESGPLNGVDLCLYTRGGDTNSVWPIVSLLREFDPSFEVLAPFRCHSSGTLVALGARRIVLGPLSELSPIDPSTGNQFNPRDPADPRSRMAISVEDVRAYRDFIAEQLKGKVPKPDQQIEIPEASLAPFLQRLTQEVHPLALGNVHRVLRQIQQLATKLLNLHPSKGEDVGAIVSSLTTHFYSHLHMINRHEAKDILGGRVEFASDDLAAAMDALLRAYEDSFNLRKTFFLASYLKGKPEAEVRFVGAVAETRSWSYLHETSGIVRQTTRIPPNVQVQIPAGQPMPLVPGLPRDTELQVSSQGWIHNISPKGVTI
ncbi:MAG: SDH family Clp fold serine proteinase [Nitrospiraceae bacterium]